MARSPPTVSLLLSGDKCIAARLRRASGGECTFAFVARIAGAVVALGRRRQADPGLSGDLSAGSMDNDNAVGFDVEMVDPITAKMKLTPAMSAMEFKGLIPARLGNRI